MLSQFPENKIHQVRWLLTIGWLILIFSLMSILFIFEGVGRVVDCSLPKIIETTR